MLPSRHRLRERSAFREATRGSRAAGRLAVVHAIRRDPPEGPVRVGFTVSRAVGGAVTRNRTRRRLRAVAAERLAGLPAGVDLVVRARPDAATATYAGLTEEVGSLLERVASRALSRSPRLSRAGR